jgi:CRISPR-associated protein Cmr6
MEKGILHIKKRPRHINLNGKVIPIKKEVPEVGREFDKLECEFEGNPVVKIVVGNQTFSADLSALEARKEQAREVDEYRKAYQNLLKNQENSNDSFSITRARIPTDTKKCLLEDGDNFYLKLNRFARYDYKDSSENEMHFKFFNAKALEKGRGADKVVVIPAIRVKENFGDLFDKENQLTDKTYQAAKSLFSSERQLDAQEFKPEWRFVTGLGGHSVYETGITLHHIYGVPFIPASSIKGVLRSWIIYTQFGNDDQGKEDLKNAEKRALQCKGFCYLFGCPAESVMKKAYQGRITFFDALPTKKPTIEPDIMNPHYPKWYGGDGRAPVDTESPIPVFFLTVKETPFLFILGTKPKENEEDWNIKDKLFWGKTLMAWLTEALSEHGIGAKTAVGYGYMKNV